MLAKIEHGQDVGVLQLGDLDGLAPEPFERRRVVVRAVEDLERYLAFEGNLAGAIDRAHGPAPDLVNDFEAPERMTGR